MSAFASLLRWDVRLQNRNGFYGASAFVLIVVGSGCGRAPEEVAPSDAATQPTSPPPAETPSASPSDSFTPGATEVPSDEPTDPGAEESDKPPVLDKGASGRALTTADFFATPDNWADGRFNVAGQKDLAGIGGPLSNCEDEASDNSPTIEIRCSG